MRVIVGILIGVAVAVFVPGGVLSLRAESAARVDALTERVDTLEHRLFRLDAAFDTRHDAMLRLHSEDMRALVWCVDTLVEVAADHSNDLAVLRRESPGLQGGEGE